MQLRSRQRTCAGPACALAKCNSVAQHVCPIAAQQRRVHSHAFSTQQSNPAIQFGRINDAVRESRADVGHWPGDMTMNGALGKTAILVAITAISAAFSWQQGISQLIAAKQAGYAIMGATGSVMQTAQVRCQRCRLLRLPPVV